MIEAYETGRAPAFELYGLKLEHKHMPEIEFYSGLTARPVFLPSVGDFRQGILVTSPCISTRCPRGPRALTFAPCSPSITGARHISM